MCIIMSLLLPLQPQPPVPVVIEADVQGGPRKGAERNAPSYCTDHAHAADTQQEEVHGCSSALAQQLSSFMPVQWLV